MLSFGYTIYMFEESFRKDRRFFDFLNSSFKISAKGVKIPAK